MTPFLYPVAEFRAVAFRAVRRGAFTALFAIATGLLFGVTAVHLVDPCGRADPTRRIALVWGTLGMAGVTLACEVLAIRARHPFLRCPHCRGRLADSVPLVVASGCCPACGRRVLEPPADEPPPESLVPRADYLNADTAHQKWGGPLLLGGVLASYLGCIGAVVSLRALALPFPLNWAVFVGLALVAPVSLAAVVRFLWASGKRNPALACPACGKLIAGARMVVAATGNCCECGCRVVVPRTRPLAPPHRGPLWTVAGIVERERKRNRRLRNVWLIVAGVSAVTAPLIPLAVVGWEAVGIAGPPGLDPRDSVALVGLVAWVAVIVGLLRWLLRGVSRTSPVPCPRCGRELFPPFARATKCCHRCGRRVVE